MITKIEAQKLMPSYQPIESERIDEVIRHAASEDKSSVDIYFPLTQMTLNLLHQSGMQVVTHPVTDPTQDNFIFHTIHWQYDPYYPGINA